MALSQQILSRINRFIPNDRPATVADIRRMHADDPDALFVLAVRGVGDDAPMAAKGFEWLARALSVLMRDGFSIATGAQQHYAKGNRGGFLALDDGQEDVRFIQDLRTGSGYDSKLQSQRRSKECLDFFLEDYSWDDAVRNSMLFRVGPDDATAINGGLPRYQRDALVDCAREVLRRPAAVYKGLRHSGPMEADGWAFCGVPTRRRMNDGTTQPPPEGFTFVVFADPQGCVFDWDWVPSLQANPAIPRDAEERFDAPPVPNVHGDLLLGNITHANPAAFKPGRAWFSEKGDCVFWYIDGAESYAAREDEYLTAFYQLSDDPKKSVGFKLKMVSKLFETIEKWAKYPGEGIQVNFNADPVRIDLKFLMNAWLAANLPRSQELFPGMRLMEKLGLKELQESSPTVDIPKSALQEMQNV